MVEWKAVPWTLWLVALLFLLSTVQIIAATPTRAELSVFAVVFMLGWLYLLFAANRWVWIGTIALFAVSLVVDLATGDSLAWYVWLLSLAELLLLLLPVTRRFFGRTT